MTPTRHDLGTDAARLWKPGLPTKADLWIVTLPAGVVVVKDFAAKSLWVRLLGRVQISRECRAYRHVGELPFLARFSGRVDGLALAVEWIEGEELARSPLRRERGAELLAELEAIVRRLHEKGLAHLDLRGRDNVLVDSAGHVRVLDLAAAVWFRPGGWAYRLCFRMFALTDEAALLKWKRLLEVGPYTEDERAFLARFEFWRGLWPFNRKRRQES